MKIIYNSTCTLNHTLFMSNVLGMEIQCKEGQRMSRKCGPVIA